MQTVLCMVLSSRSPHSAHSNQSLISLRTPDLPNVSLNSLFMRYEPASIFLPLPFCPFPIFCLVVTLNFGFLD